MSLPHDIVEKVNDHGVHTPSSSWNVGTTA